MRQVHLKVVTEVWKYFECFVLTDVSMQDPRRTLRGPRGPEEKVLFWDGETLRIGICATTPDIQENSGESPKRPSPHILTPASALKPLSIS